jgi:serine/threonine protein kinase
MRHPGIIALHEGFQDGQYIYLVMELCEGGDMFSLINSISNDISLSMSRDRLAKHYLSQLLETMCYIHQREIIHRDLKPENVVLDTNKNMKLIDFGTCKILNQSILSQEAL